MELYFSMFVVGALKTVIYGKINFIFFLMYSSVAGEYTQVHPHLW